MKTTVFEPETEALTSKDGAKTMWKAAICLGKTKFGGHVQLFKVIK